MANEHSRRRLKAWPIAVGILLLAAGWFLWQLIGSNTPIVVSRETTFINEPLREDGLPDYPRYLLEQGSEGVTPENNAAVLYLRALWPADIPPELRLPMCSALGLEEPPETPGAWNEIESQAELRAFVDWVKVSGVFDAKQVEDVTDGQWESWSSQAGEVWYQPWKRVDYPTAADWVDRMTPRLDLIVEGSKRPRYFCPSPSLAVGAPDGLIAIDLNQIQAMRSAARALSHRSMLHIGEGDPESAWADLLAMHRMGRHIGSGRMLIHRLVGYAIIGIANSNTAVLLHESSLSSDQARQILTDLSTLPPTPTVAQSLDEGERFWFIDSTLRMSGLLTSGTGANQKVSLIDDPLFGTISLLSTDWNLVLRIGNGWYDRLAEAAKQPTREARIDAMSAVEADLALLSPGNSPGAVIASAVSRRRRSELLADVLMGLFLPALSAATNAEDRVNAHHQMAVTAAALAVHRAEQGEYPERLEQLVPGVLDAPPLDLYSGKPFLYERRGEGYLLYSVYEDGEDNGGNSMDGDIVAGEYIEESDAEAAWNDGRGIDLVIRVPAPRAKLPPLPEPGFGYGYGGFEDYEQFGGGGYGAPEEPEVYGPMQPEPNAE